MAVYTEVSNLQLTTFLEDYDIGSLVFIKGIADGISNTNFILQTTSGTYILTLYEEERLAENLPFFVALLGHLAAQGIACPIPIKKRDGTVLGHLAGRPAAITSFLKGVSLRRPTSDNCGALGVALARFHKAAKNFPQQLANSFGPTNWADMTETCGPKLDTIRPKLHDILKDEIKALCKDWPEALPRGLIHADLFPDNVFFLDGKVTGLIDFYAACDDFHAYDIAICLNAWCFETDGAFNVTKSKALLRGYEAEKPLLPEERNALPILCRGAATRFLLTRACDFLNPPEGALVHTKDPLEYWRKLRFHQRVSSSRDYGLASAHT